MKTRILSSRTRPPELRKNFVNRPFLLNKIGMITTKKLLVVEAGAGRGKTTAVISFLSDQPMDTVKWVRLASDCNHLFVFWSYLVEVLEPQLGDLKKEFLDFFQATANKQTIDDMIIFLCNCLFESQALFLVLDDFHFIENQEVLDSFELFLSESPNSLHIILLSRHQPSLYLGMLEMTDQLQYVEEKDFLLTNREALQFIENTTGTALTALEKQEFIRIANGWIGGLQLLIAANLRTGITKLNDFNQSDRMLSDYLSKEIFQQLSEEEKDFLIKTAYFNYVNENLSLKVVPAIDFQKIMTKLLTKNLLIECVDTAQQVYQYHPIFKEFLIKKFEQFPFSEKHTLCQLAATSFVIQGDFDEALRLLLELKEYHQVMNVILDDSDSIRSLYYIGKVPVNIAVKNIDFAYQKIFYHYSNLEYACCTELIDLLEKEYPHAQEIKAVEGLKLLLGIDLASINQTTVTLAEIEQLKLNQTSKAFILLKNATVYYFQDRYWEAIQLINTSNQLNKKDKNPFLTYFNRTLLAQLYEEIGELNKSIALLTDIEERFQLSQFNPTMRKNYSINFHITITGIYLKQFELEKAAKTLRKVKNQKDDHLQAAFLYNKAEFLYLSNQPAEAFKIVQKFEVETSSYSSPFIKSGLIKYCLKNDQLSKNYQDSFIKNYHEKQAYQNMNNQLFYILILLKQKNLAQALSMIDCLLVTSRRDKLFLKTVEGTLLKLTILLEMNSSDERLLKNLYGESLYYASENSIKAPFYLYKETVTTLHHLFGSHLVEKLEPKEQQFHKEVLLICSEKRATLLTTREQEVLAEIAQGATNKEMAQTLFVSEATIKTHILNIYRKLEVNSRITVVEKARELNLL